MGEDTKAFRDKIQELVKSGKKNILLNLGGISHMDSSGLGELVYGFAHVNNHGGQIKLLNLTQKLNQLLVITKLVTVFETYQDEKRALTSFVRSGSSEARRRGATGSGNL